ncbi:peroxidase family protein [Streptomyces sp. PmtG]
MRCGGSENWPHDHGRGSGLAGVRSELEDTPRDNDGQVLQSVPHEQALLNIGIVNKYGIGPVLRGFASQVMQEVDVSVIEAMRSIRFPGAPPLDLVAVDIQRARDRPGIRRRRGVRCVVPSGRRVL